jgi:hypothetical protein
MARTLSSVTGSLFDAAGTTLDTITKTITMVDNIVDVGLAHTGSWRARAIDQSIIDNFENRTTVTTDAGKRYVQHLDSIRNYSDEQASEYNAYVAKCLELLNKK